MNNKNKNRKLKCLVLLNIFLFGLILTFTGLLFAQEKEPNNQLQSTEENPSINCLEKGQELFWQQEYNEALRQLKKCLEQDPENPEIYYYLGQCYFQKGQLSAQKKSPIKAYQHFQDAYEISEIAVEKYQEQIEKNPDEDHTSQYLQLAYIYQIRSLMPGVDEYQKALDIYQKLLAEKPNIISVYYHMGWIYFQQEEYQDSIDSFLKYLKPGIKSDFVYYHLGLSYDKIGEKQNAEYYFRLILEEFPETEMANRAKKELD